MVCALIGMGLVATPATTKSAPPAACSSAAFHEFDFTAGDWDVYDVGARSKIVARNHITPMVGGCALREVYEQK